MTKEESEENNKKKQTAKPDPLKEFDPNNLVGLNMKQIYDLYKIPKTSFERSIKAIKPLLLAEKLRLRPDSPRGSQYTSYTEAVIIISHIGAPKKK